MSEILYLVVPCYNEEEVLSETASRLVVKLDSMIGEKLISDKSRVLFVDDGSKDRTWKIIRELWEKEEKCCGLKLTRNKGHQNALLAGLMVAKNLADMVISLDADLQDDIEVLDDFVRAYYQGNDIVYGVRSTRDTDSFFKRYTAVMFYRVMKLLGTETIENHADYRLMSKRALEALSSFKEVNLFLRGMIPLLGYQTAVVTYERHERFAGDSKYPLKKMLAFAIDGITSFSIKPIRVIGVIGIVIFFISIFVSFYFLLRKIWGYTVDGWASLACSMWMLGGVQLLSLGIIGEYIGKIYAESKSRPHYLIEKSLLHSKDEEYEDKKHDYTK